MTLVANLALRLQRHLRAYDRPERRGRMASVHFITFGIAMFAAMAGCAEKDIPKADADREITALRAHYLKHYIGGGFNVVGIRTQGQTLVASLMIRDREQACNLKRKGASQLRMVASVACPYADDPVWGQLDPKRDIKLNVACDGEVFYVHSCRSGRRVGKS